MLRCELGLCLRAVGPGESFEARSGMTRLGLRRVPREAGKVGSWLGDGSCSETRSLGSAGQSKGVQSRGLWEGQVPVWAPWVQMREGRVGRAEPSVGDSVGVGAGL